MTLAALFSSASVHWSTPEELLRALDAERAAHAETKSRLALAEAVCESCYVGSAPYEPDSFDESALAAWRAAK